MKSWRLASICPIERAFFGEKSVDWRSDEEEESDESADWVPGYSKTSGRFVRSDRSDPEPDRLARLYANLMEDTRHPKRFDLPRYEIEPTRGDASGDQHENQIPSPFRNLAFRALGSSGAIG